jgi:hypothetical protein
VKSIAERISELTGIPERTVRDKLSQRYKIEHSTAASAMGAGQAVKVPKALAPIVRKVVESVKEITDALSAYVKN